MNKLDIEFISPKSRRLASFIFFQLFILAACNFPTPGPQAWIDRPLDGSSFPIEPITIQAHASDLDGVETLLFSIDESQISSVSVSGRRLVDGAIEWTPLEPGTYTIQVQGIDSSGNVGSQAVSVIHVGDLIDDVSSTPPPSLSPSSTEVESSAPSTSTPTSAPNTDTPSPAPNTDTPTPAPAASSTSTQLPPTSTNAPTSAPTQTPDTTPPSIVSVEALPDEILTEGTGCPSYPRTTQVTAVVTDGGSLKSVIAQWAIGGESGQVDLVFIGGNVFQGEIGPVTITGQMEIKVIAQDSAANSSVSNLLYVDVDACIT